MVSVKRERLPNRRQSETFDFKYGGLRLEAPPLQGQDLKPRLIRALPWSFGVVGNVASINLDRRSPRSALAIRGNTMSSDGTATRS
jgi:hypothetical protein